MKKVSRFYNLDTLVFFTGKWSKSPHVSMYCKKSISKHTATPVGGLFKRVKIRLIANKLHIVGLM